MDKVKELVVTLRASTGDVVKVAELKASGERRELAEQEFGDLVAHGEEESLIAALEEAYAAGAEDAAGDDDGAAEVRILWDAAARLRLRSTVRRLILGRALQRMTVPSSPKETKTAPRSPAARRGAAHARGSHTEH